MILNLIGTKIYIWQEESLESEANHCSDPYIVFVKQHFISYTISLKPVLGNEFSDMRILQFTFMSLRP